MNLKSFKTTMAGETDPNYEFDAPMYMDFARFSYDDGADTWFENCCKDGAIASLATPASEMGKTLNCSSREVVVKRTNKWEHIPSPMLNYSQEGVRVDIYDLPTDTGRERKALEHRSKRVDKPKELHRKIHTEGQEFGDAKRLQLDGKKSLRQSLQLFQKQTKTSLSISVKESKTTTEAKSNTKRRMFEADVTLPKTPKLLTKGRSRPVTAKSAAQLEDEEVSKMKEYQFKANPVDHKIFLKPRLQDVACCRGQLQPNVPQTSDLKTREKFVSMKDSKARDSTKNEVRENTFRARPMPNFDKVKGVPEKTHHPITEPESPAITNKKRRHDEKDANTEEEVDSHCVKANPMPDLNKIFKVRLPHRILQAEPFTFEERYKDKPTRETIVEKILQNEKNPEFKAQFLPDFGDGPALPSKSQQPLTHPCPFNLQTGIRGQQHSTKFQEEVRVATHQSKKNKEFKAQEASVLYKDPFIPSKPHRPLKDVENIVLHTEVRSEKRAKFDAEKYRKEREMELENLKRQAIREAEEAKDIAELRRNLVHKAQPIHQYCPVVVKPSDKPVTEPIAPHFHTEKRMREQ